MKDIWYKCHFQMHEESNCWCFIEFVSSILTSSCIWVQFFFLRCTKILSQHHPFLSFLPSLFLLCEVTFMNDYDGIYNCNSLKYNHSKKFDNFWLINFYGDQNIGLKMISLRTRPYSLCVVHLKIFSHFLYIFIIALKGVLNFFW